MDKTNGKPRPLVFAVLVLGSIIPGLGHVLVGRIRKGIIVFVVIGATFWSGVAVGGVMTVDYHNQRWWFAAQMLAGVHGLIGWYRQDGIYRTLSADPEVGIPPHPRSEAKIGWNYRLDRRLAGDGLAIVSPTDTVARAYSGVAGLLNLMCVFDAVILSLIGVSGETAPLRRKVRETGEEK